jgi:hypothetical protein
MAIETAGDSSAAISGAALRLEKAKKATSTETTTNIASKARPNRPVYVGPKRATGPRLRRVSIRGCWDRRVGVSSGAG